MLTVSIIPELVVFPCCIWLLCKGLLTHHQPVSVDTVACEDAHLLPSTLHVKYWAY